MPVHVRDWQPIVPRLNTAENHAAARRADGSTDPRPGQSAPDAHAVAQQLRPVLLKVNRYLRGEAHDLGVTSTQASLLGAINRTPGVGLAELAQREHMSAPTLGSHIDKLEALGLVTRGRTDPTDRRRIQLELTDEGQSTLTTLRDHRTTWLASRLASLSPEALATISAAIGPLQQLVETSATEQPATTPEEEQDRPTHTSEEQSK